VNLRRSLTFPLLLVLMTACRYQSTDEIMRQVEAEKRAALEEERATQSEAARLDAKDALINAMLNNPDLPAWHTQREQLALALGDRRIDAPFDTVYDAFVVALASLGSRVYQTERASGYIAATLPPLPPEQQKVLADATMREYAAAKGYPANVLDPAANPEDDPVDTSAIISRFVGGLTVSLIRQGDAVSKAKLRFTDIYYPRTIEAHYAAVWRAVDKQLFLDKGLD
jgi:hypothetical protein